MPALKISLFVPVVIIAAALTTFAQATPSLSRGLQELSITQDECYRRVRPALEQEGYKLFKEPGPDFMFGFKGVFSAVIMCNAGPNGKTWVNIVVASSIADDGTKPGAERVNLQHRMDPQEPIVTSGTTWSTQPNEITREVGKQVTVTCPPNGTISSKLWGSDLYTDDSSVCTAAVHAGLITVQRGGPVTFQTREGMSSYAGSVRNGVTSREYGSWSGSFFFLR